MDSCNFIPNPVAELHVQRWQDDTVAVAARLSCRCRRAVPLNLPAHAACHVELLMAGNRSLPVTSHTDKQPESARVVGSGASAEASRRLKIERDREQEQHIGNEGAGKGSLF